MAPFSKLNAVKTTPHDHNRDADRISALPDVLICHILSFLPTKLAVATSVPSSRWRYLFISVPDIDIDISVPDNVDNSSLIFETEEAYDKLLCDALGFGVRLLLLGNGAPIRKLCLKLWRLPESALMAIDVIISAAVLCYVQEIRVSVQQQENCNHLRLLPVGTFTCKTLVVLHLYRNVDMKVPGAVSLPNLKVLYLVGLMLLDEDSLPRLIQGCPLLEELYLDLKVTHNRGNVDNIQVVHISSASVRKLILYYQGPERPEYTLVVDAINLKSLKYFAYGDHNAFVIVNAPNLEVLDFSSDSACEFDITKAHDLKYWTHGDHVAGVNFCHNLTSLVSARISAEYEVLAEDRLIRGQKSFKLMCGLQSVKSLCLSEIVLTVFSYCQSLLPTFTNLISLELQTGWLFDADSIRIWKTLPRLLESSPNLEVLIIDEIFLHVESGRIEEFECLLFEGIPVCFIERLKEIEMRKFYYGGQYEFKLVEYFLQNGKSLEKMTLWTCAPGACSRSVRKLALKRCSANCQIVIKRMHQGWKDCF